MAKDKPTAVVYDLDSTVCDTSPRWHLSPLSDPASTWDRYALGCADDIPIPGTVARMRLDWPVHQVHIAPGRSAVAEALTRKWLGRHIGPYWDALSLQYAGTIEDNAQVKADYILALIAAGIEVVLDYEDRPDVAKRIASLTGVPVMVVNPCYDLTDHESVGLASRGTGQAAQRS